MLWGRVRGIGLSLVVLRSLEADPRPGQAPLPGWRGSGRPPQLPPSGWDGVAWCD